jgi:hypothetical protein
MRHSGNVSRSTCAVVVAGLVFVALGCGSGGGNNDQGIVFRAMGVFAEIASIEEDMITCTAPLMVDGALSDTAFTISLSGTRQFPDENDAFGNPCGGFLGLQNNLTNQSINVTEISFRYEIPGAGVAIGPWSQSTGVTIPSSTFQGTTSSGEPNVVFVHMLGNIVPQPIIVELNQNVNRLPGTPYVMNVFITARGQSDQGTNYETNEVGYTITVDS